MALVACASAEPQARCLHAAVGVGQNMLIWAGNGGMTDIKSSIIEVFNVKSATWKEPVQLSCQCLPENLESMAVASDGEKAYFWGGLVGPIEAQKRIGSLYCLDLQSLQCSEIISAGPSPSPRAGSCMVMLKQKLVVYGGSCDDDAKAEVLVFNLDTSET